MRGYAPVFQLKCEPGAVQLAAKPYAACTVDAGCPAEKIIQRVHRVCNRNENAGIILQQPAAFVGCGQVDIEQICPGLHRWISRETRRKNADIGIRDLAHVRTDPDVEPRMGEVEDLCPEKRVHAVADDQIVRDPPGSCKVRDLAADPAHSHHCKAHHLVPVWAG